MPLTPAGEIKLLLREAYDPEQYASYYRQMRYAFGEKWNDDDGYGSVKDGDFPDFPAVKLRSLGIGQSRRILTTSFVDLANNMYSPGEPEFPQVDAFTAEVRKQYWFRRAEGGDWDTSRGQAFLEGNGLGVGFLQIGHETNPLTQKTRVTVRHSPTIFTLWDPFEPSASRASYVCFVHHLPYNKAVALYGKADVEKSHADDEDDTGGGHKLRTVRVFEYYDLGLSRWDPTRAVILGKMSNDPILRKASLWKRRLPMAFYEHLLAPGMKRPIGRIPLQMATQEALNELEAYFRKTAQDKSVDIWDATFINASDFAAVKNGTTDKVRTAKPLKAGDMPMIRVPGSEISAAAMQLLQYLQAQFNEESGTNEYQRGGRPDEVMTATEVSTMQQQTQRQGGWSDKQTDKFAVRLVEGVMEAAGILDDDPIEIDIRGINVPLNSAEHPDLNIGAFVEEASRTLIKEGSLQYVDRQQEGASRLNQLAALQPFAGVTISIQKLTEETLRAIGEEDVEPWMQPPAPPAAQGGQVDAQGNPVPEDPNAPPAGQTGPPNPQGPQDPNQIPPQDPASAQGAPQPISVA